MPIFVGIGKERAWTESEGTTTSMPTHALDINGPMTWMCMVLHVMLLMRATPLRGQVEGVGPWKSKLFFLGLVKWHRAVRQMPFGAQKSQKHYVQGRINQRLIGSFMYMSFCVMCYVFCDLCCAFCILYSVVYFVILCFSFTARPFKWPSLP